MLPACMRRTRVPGPRPPVRPAPSDSTQKSSTAATQVWCAALAAGCVCCAVRLPTAANDPHSTATRPRARTTHGLWCICVATAPELGSQACRRRWTCWSPSRRRTRPCRTPICTKWRPPSLSRCMKCCIAAAALLLHMPRAVCRVLTAFSCARAAMHTQAASDTRAADPLSLLCRRSHRPPNITSACRRTQNGDALRPR